VSGPAIRPPGQRKIKTISLKDPWFLLRVASRTVSLTATGLHLGAVAIRLKAMNSPPSSLRLLLRDQDLLLHPGETAEFGTRVSHWFGSSTANWPFGRSHPQASRGTEVRPRPALKAYRLRW
jgi:hypothetical protein